MFGVPGLAYDAFALTRFVLDETWVGETAAGRWARSSVIGQIERVVGPVEDAVISAYDSVVDWMNRQRFLLLLQQFRGARPGMTQAEQLDDFRGRPAPHRSCNITAVTPEAGVIEFDWGEGHLNRSFELLANTHSRTVEIFNATAGAHGELGDPFASMAEGAAATAPIPASLRSHVAQATRDTWYRLAA